MNNIRLIALLVLIVAFPLTLWLPPWTSWEDGPIENAQAVVLFIGAIVAVVYAVKSPDRQRFFWLAVVPVWLVMCARELSWGAVLLDPLSVTDHGAQYSSSQLWYRPYVKPGLIAVLVLAIASFVRGGGVGLLSAMLMQRRFPFGDLVGCAVGMLLSAAAEGHMGLSLGHWGEKPVMEETAELAAYIFLLSAQACVHRALRGLC
ncbi:MAG TPA: hypothetical protein VGC31_03805 [Paenirhodobacter sp.]